ncbi:MAG: NAD(P)H-binding protein [Polyangia bacterium]
MEKRLLLTGATGFVGSAVHPALVAAGWSVRCLTRDPDRARARWPRIDWAAGDVTDEASCRRALSGCTAALYLVHSMGEGAGYQRRDGRAARCFARAAAAAGVQRLVYLGGMLPEGTPSRHLRSRIEVGRLLREGRVPTLELRASMIVGYGSLSWLVVRDLAARLPAMVLPRWLESRTEPVAIDDVVVALVRALELPELGSACFDIPGPQALSGQEIIEETARAMGLPRAKVLRVPLLTPRLSALWVRFVTRARWSVAREIVVGLQHDVLARDDRFWQLIHHPRRLTFAEAAERAIQTERAAERPHGAWGMIELVRGRAP